jgi:hypothetical protein
MPKDRLRRLTLYPTAAMDRAARALLLLRKALQLVQAFALTERETRYLLTHPADFGGLDLSKLPAEPEDDTAGGAQALFGQFLRLAGYAALRQDLAGGTDDLVGVFEANGGGDVTQVYPLIAAITRRDASTVEAAAQKLWSAPSFPNEEALDRLWQALQVVERFGVPVEAIAGWTSIVAASATAEDRFVTARGLKQTLQARFEPEAWRTVAQPIFDRLRQRQRDGLVAHVMHQKGFARLEQLYEFFLVDPGMEPVVRTSRIRLALGSVQLFIQRCLLNLETQVHPTVINARQWEWMKRYRVWEANRKIFLFPENWLEPEFRDDKTHLFAELEGMLLQGDVSNDLVEDAFLIYLRKLDQLARLDVVAMHLEYQADPALNTLHVIGRTYGQPHQYFYRRYAHEMWTAWEPVTVEIQGDHLAPVVWRDRLYLFWVTFLDKPDDDPQPGTKTAGTKLADAEMGKVVSDIQAAGAYKTVEAHLHWSEYVDGTWSVHESGGLAAVLRQSVPRAFDPSSVSIHVSKEPYEDGEERGVYIHLGGAIQLRPAKLADELTAVGGVMGRGVTGTAFSGATFGGTMGKSSVKVGPFGSFYLAGRNSSPEDAPYHQAPPSLPYSSVGGVHVTTYPGSGALTVTFARKTTTEDFKQPLSTMETQSILQQGGSYRVLPPNNDIVLGSPDIAALVKPVFYADNAHTLFIEPGVTEKTIEQWEEWVVQPPRHHGELHGGHLKELVRAGVPERHARPPTDPRDPVWRPGIDERSIVKPKPEQDWLLHPATGLLFDSEVIGSTGRTGLKVVASARAVDALDSGTTLMNAHPASDVSTDSAVVAVGGETTGLNPIDGGFNLVGHAGLNRAMAENFLARNRSGLDVTRLAGGFIDR